MPNFIIKYCLCLAILLILSACREKKDIITVFPLANYDQSVAAWVNPNDPSYDAPQISPELQQKQFDVFFKHYFGSLSPWNSDHIRKILHEEKDLRAIEKSLVANYNNQNKPVNEIGYGENFRPHSSAWVANIAKNMHLAQFEKLSLKLQNRAIAIQNLHARTLPTDDVSFYSYKIAGQGYPFDNLQISALWAGTPVYILGETQDRAWLLVVSPDFIAWVKSSGIARVDENFVQNWQTAAKKHLMAITKTATSIIDSSSQFQFLAYVGAVFPGDTNANSVVLMIPSMDLKHHAIIKRAKVAIDAASNMPLQATPHHFANLLSTLIGRPYGWGNMYFYNDCSGELKNLLAPFGIWLPRHSSEQIYAGKVIDVSALSKEKRLDYLMENGRRFFTLVYIGGHIFMYMGNFPNPNDKKHTPMALTYQNAWGLKPNPSTRRAVIGQAVFLPLLLQYPEDTDLVSQADKTYFRVSYLDEIPNYLTQYELIDLKQLMNPTD